MHPPKPCQALNPTTINRLMPALPCCAESGGSRITAAVPFAARILKQRQMKHPLHQQRQLLLLPVQQHRHHLSSSSSYRATSVAGKLQQQQQRLHRAVVEPVGCLPNCHRKMWCCSKYGCQSWALGCDDCECYTLILSQSEWPWVVLVTLMLPPHTCHTADSPTKCAVILICLCVC